MERRWKEVLREGENRRTQEPSKWKKNWGRLSGEWKVRRGDEGKENLLKDTLKMAL